ncbi:hypothetical protein PAXINDRAFT_22215 [Paxillus involutus ATCC 200175]|uniref:Uncharacterized protein n=1 Tax=Paxillus involutus ATCC 200175 TaxID=664439 RepID=A0A0C9TB45_PAXIN|nr:hypothetical protein PAXINDRAFT_22215 [Paxillus involutus ATCC 200175]
MFHVSWASLLPSLVQEYLTWKASNGCLYPNQPPPGTTDFTFNIRTVNIFTLSMTATIPHTDDSLSPVLALVSARYLGNSPHNPSVAVFLKTLEHYRLLHVHKPSFSAEAFAKVEKQVNMALGCDTPNWQVLNACLPCTHKLDDEPFLKYSCIDTRQFTESNYLLPHTYVDMFATEVQSSVASRDDHVSDDSNEAGDDDTQAAHTLNPISKDCSKNWKAAASDEKKRMWAIFDETGIFVAACRHGLILWYTDMVKSGELAKYPLAIIAKVLDVIGEHTLGAYVIGCGFQSTVHSSSLGSDFAKKESHHPIMYQIWECDQATNFNIIGMSTGQPMSAHIDFSAIDPWADIG